MPFGFLQKESDRNPSQVFCDCLQLADLLQRWADTLQYVTAGKLDKVTFFSYPDFSFL